MTSGCARAKFIGKDGSLGYRYGQVYLIEIKVRPDYIWVSCFGHSPCPYSNMVGFSKNWDLKAVN